MICVYIYMYIMYSPMAVTLGTRRAPEKKKREQVKKPTFLKQGNTLLAVTGIGWHSRL